MQPLYKRKECRLAPALACWLATHWATASTMVGQAFISPTTLERAAEAGLGRQMHWRAAHDMVCPSTAFDFAPEQCRNRIQPRLATTSYHMHNQCCAAPGHSTLGFVFARPHRERLLRTPSQTAFHAYAQLVSRLRCRQCLAEAPSIAL